MGEVTTRVCLGACMLLGLAGCGSSSDSSGGPVVGSGEVTSRTVEVMFVEEVRIELPFKAVVHSGTERQVVLRGEDNLIDLIEVTETDVSKWDIVAPLDLDVEQHEDVVIEIPFVEMVSITVTGDVEFADHPFQVWDDENPAPDAGG